MTEKLELLAAVVWLVAGVVEIFVRRYEHKQMMLLVKAAVKSDV